MCFYAPEKYKDDFILKDSNNNVLNTFSEWYKLKKYTIQNILPGFFKLKCGLGEQIICEEYSNIYIDTEMRNFLLSVFGSKENIKSNVYVIKTANSYLLYFKYKFIECLAVTYKDYDFNTDIALLKSLLNKEDNNNLYITVSRCLFGNNKNYIITEELKNKSYFTNTLKFNNFKKNVIKFLAGKHCKDYCIFYNNIEDKSKNIDMEDVNGK